MRAATQASTQSSDSWQQALQNRILLVVLSMIVLIPLLASPSNQAMQDLAIKAIQVVAALLAGLLIMRARLPQRIGDVVTFLGTGANLAVLLFFLASVVSLLLGPKDPPLFRLGLTELQRFLAGVLLYFALAYHVRRSGHLTRISNELVYVAGLFSILGLSTLAVQATNEHAILFGDHQLFGGFLMLLLPMPLIAAVTEQEPKPKLVAQVCAVLTFVCLIMSGLRSAWFGAVAMLVALSLFSLIGSRTRDRVTTFKKHYIVPLLTLVACCAFVALQGDIGRTIRRRIYAGNKTLITRQLYWNAAEQLLVTRPVFGIGLGMFPLYQLPYSGEGRPASVVLQNRPALSEMAHNFWLQTAAEQGLVGVSLFAAIIATFLVAGLRRLRHLHGGIRRSLLLASLAGMVGFCIDAMSNPAWQYAQVSIFFWLLLGLGVAALRPRATIDSTD
ncbi:MAG TPA: O-antigen ligase family protein [Chthonomonadaceae bacterium]|nr:O-antigen ligase family protein [Chthonomonadaceae bacterium]